MQQQQKSVTSSASVSPWHQHKLDRSEVTPTNYHRRSRREEVQLPMPETNPIIRANILLEESMRHNWANNAKVFQQHTMLKAQAEGRAIDPRQMQDELEYMWFQFKCEWQQLRTDVLSEMCRVPVPEALRPKTTEELQRREVEFKQLSSSDFEEKLREEARDIEAGRKTYLESLRQAFYPTTLMELFQKDLAPFEADMNLCLLPSGRGHWAQLQALYLYQQQMARQAHEAERLRRQQLAEKMTLANLTSGPKGKAPEIAIELVDIDLDEESDNEDELDDAVSVSTANSSKVDINNYHQLLHPTAGGRMPGRQHSSSDSCDDASSFCGMSSAESAISSSRSLGGPLADQYDSPVTSPQQSRNNRQKSSSNNNNQQSSDNNNSRGSTPLDQGLKHEDIAYPLKRQHSDLGPYQDPAHLHEVMNSLSQLTTTEGMQCPLDYHAVRHDEETRAQVFMSRRERKAFILAAMPEGRLFMTV